MSEPYYFDGQVSLWHGDSLAVLRELPDASVDCCVTSPPYFGLRDYGSEGQYGLEESPAAYVEQMRQVFAEVRRVLANDGTLWLNIGDSYYSGKGNPGPNAADEKQVARRGWTRALDKPGVKWAKPKNLLGIPWRTAFALQDDGWTVRAEVIWAKRNPTPDPAIDRPGRSHEQVFLMSKGRRYWYDAKIAGGDTPRSVWTLASQPFAGTHSAVMPVEMAERCVLSGCKPGGTVLDPFSGSGTTGLAATKHGRTYVGIDLSSDCLDLSLRTRLVQPGFDFGGVA